MSSLAEGLRKGRDTVTLTVPVPNGREAHPVLSGGRHTKRARTCPLLFYPNEKTEVSNQRTMSQERYSLMEGSLSGQVWFAK